MVVMGSCIILKCLTIVKKLFVFKKDEFTSSFKSLMKQIEFINNIELKFNRQDDYNYLFYGHKSWDVSILWMRHS